MSMLHAFQLVLGFIAVLVVGNLVADCIRFRNHKHVIRRKK